MFPIEQVVAVHYGAYMRFRHACFKSWKVDLAQRASVHDRVDVVTIELGVIGGEVFHRGDNSFALHTFDKSDRSSPREKRVFARIFKIAPVQRRTINIDPWRQEEVHTPSPRVLPHAVSNPTRQSRIPRRRKRDSSSIRS